MKVLTAGSTILTFPPLGGDKFVGLDGKQYAEGIVAEQPSTLTALVKNAIPTGTTIDTSHPFSFTQASEVMRDLRWIGKRLVDCEVGATVKMKVTGRGYSLDIPQDAKPQTATPKVGDVIAVGHNITPKALMNARGVVTAVNGTRLTAKLTQGDLRRVERSTGKRFPVEVRLPVASCEVDTETLVA